MNLVSSNQTILLGHKKEFMSLVNLYSNNNFPNKILFSGEKGIGKSTLAYHLVNYILSLHEDNPYNLEKLEINIDNKSFKLTQNKSNPNFTLIDVTEDKKYINIEQIRNLILSLNKSSFNTKPRFILIDNIELLNTNSVNALLKIVEEPNDNIFFILINNNKKVLSTLKSRCLNFKFFLPHHQSIEIINTIINDDLNNFINKEFITNYSTPGNLLDIINYANQNDIDLKKIGLKEFITHSINDKKYKKDKSIKELIYSLIEVYFRNNTSINNMKFMYLHNYFLNKINNTKIFNLDDEILFMEFEDKVLNG
ncbi:AAA family ATPase [Candidatus Pelagibacter sp.]|jgi:DNA polymerase-3 subunit delta'|nr:AAA family ATPase [Candidatus Pelagibacter sp.]|tara:strand:+ start:1784 stop:2713 length:930 start_codon:yes stop_codon:yes gene_type:complete